MKVLAISACSLFLVGVNGLFWYIIIKIDNGAIRKFEGVKKMSKENDKCTHCGKDTGQIDSANRKAYCNETECKQAFIREVLRKKWA